MLNYILDTNVLNELFVTTTDNRVLTWYRVHNPDSFYLTTLSIAEIRFGIEKLPLCSKRSSLETWLRDLIRNFDHRTLSFDIKSAHVWGQMTARDRKNGRPRPHMDGLLASIAIAHDMTLVTRNTKDFSGLDLSLINPF